MTKVSRQKQHVEEPQPAADALAEVLTFPTAQDLGTSYDILRLLGAVVGQKRLLELAMTSQDSKAAVSAARALASLKEDPAVIVERMRAGPFAGLTTADLRDLTAEIQDGADPRRALEKALARATKERSA